MLEGQRELEDGCIVDSAPGNGSRLDTAEGSEGEGGEAGESLGEVHLEDLFGGLRFGGWSVC